MTIAIIGSTSNAYKDKTGDYYNEMEHAIEKQAVLYGNTLSTLKEEGHLMITLEDIIEAGYFVADEEGNVVDGDKLLLIFGSYLDKEGLLKENTIVITVMSNLGLKVACKERGIKTLETAVGDRYVIEGMKESGAVLGGEQYWHEYYDESGKYIGYYQEVAGLNNASFTVRSMIDLQPSPEQLNIFYEKDIAFTVVNEDGALKVHVTGVRPEQDYTIQCTVTEVAING